MRKVILIHQRSIQHYRVAVYSHLHIFLASMGWSLIVTAQGVEDGNPHDVKFDLRSMPMGFRSLRSLIANESPDAVIFFVNPKELYLFPLLVWIKSKKIPVIFWGHGIDLQNKSDVIKRLVYALEHCLFDAIILYSNDQKKYICRHLHYKVFCANNTINTNILKRRCLDKEAILSGYGILTKKNIICVGRLQKRKRIGDLIDAFRKITIEDVGLILVGPDVDGVLRGVVDKRIVVTGPVYGDAVQELLECADVYCMPGHVGLSIVDAFFYGLPLVTENVDHAPEIMYLRDGVNGFIVQAGDTEALAQRLELLLGNDALRKRFSLAAQKEIEMRGNIDTMCAGFTQALNFVVHQ